MDGKWQMGVWKYGTQPRKTCSGGHIITNQTQYRCRWCVFAYAENKLEYTKQIEQPARKMYFRRLGVLRTTRLENLIVLRRGRAPAVAARRPVLAADALGQVTLVDARHARHFCAGPPQPKWILALQQAQAQQRKNSSNL